MHQRFMVLVLPVLLAISALSYAGDLNVHVILAGEVAPGVYGQVQLGSDPPPPLVYVQPTLIEPQAVYPTPIFLHVPPDHAKNWRKHCHEYNACSRRVYFVRSAEYEPGYERRNHDPDDGRGHDDEHGHVHGHDHDRHDDN